MKERAELVLPLSRSADSSGEDCEAAVLVVERSGEPVCRTARGRGRMGGGGGGGDGGSAEAGRG